MKPIYQFLRHCFLHSRCAVWLENIAKKAAFKLFLADKSVFFSFFSIVPSYVKCLMSAELQPPVTKMRVGVVQYS